MWEREQLKIITSLHLAADVLYEGEWREVFIEKVAEKLSFLTK